MSRGVGRGGAIASVSASRASRAPLAGAGACSSIDHRTPDVVQGANGSMTVVLHAAAAPDPAERHLAVGA